MFPLCACFENHVCLDHVPFCFDVVFATAQTLPSHKDQVDIKTLNATTVATVASIQLKLSKKILLIFRGGSRG